jgi:putative membrane protein
MKRTILTYLGIATLAIMSACGTDDSVELAAKQSIQQFEAAGVQDMDNDALFAAEAASASMLQMQLSETALSRGVSSEVRDFAEMMVKDHRQMLDDLQSLSTQTQLVLPQTLGKAHQKTYDEATERDGISFDVEYIREMVHLHKELLDRYEDMAENGRNMNVKQYASKQLPIIRKHLEKAEELEEKID